MVLRDASGLLLESAAIDLIEPTRSLAFRSNCSAKFFILPETI